MEEMKSKKKVAVGIALAVTMLTSIGVASATPFIEFNGTIWSACSAPGPWLPAFCMDESGPHVPQIICYGEENPTRYWSYTHLYNGSGSAIAFNELPSLEGEAPTSITMTATGGFNETDFHLTDIYAFYTYDGAIINETFTVQTFSGGNVSIYLNDSEILTIEDATLVLTSNLCTQKITGYGEGTITGVQRKGFYEDFTGYPSKNNIAIKVHSMRPLRLSGEDPADFLFTLRFMPLYVSVVNQTYPACTVADSYHSTIQSAVNAANNSDTIIVCPGTYNENVDINKSLTIRSYSGNPADTIVNASNPNDHVFNVTMNHVDINGFTVKGATGLTKAGIYLQSALGCIIRNSKINNNSDGITIYDSDHCDVHQNEVADNSDIGISLQSDSDNNELYENEVTRNSDIGISLASGCDNNELNNNNVCRNSKDISNYGTSNTGDYNLCGISIGWNDEGTAGCKLQCVGWYPYNYGFGFHNPSKDDMSFGHPLDSGNMLEVFGTEELYEMAGFGTKMPTDSGRLLQ